MKNGLEQTGKEWRRLGLLWLLMMIVGWVMLLALPSVERLDYQLFDAQQRIMRAKFPRPSKAEVALIGIDEQAISEIEPPMALWHEQIGELIEAMGVADARVLGFDLVLPERSFDTFLGRDHDQALMSAMVAARDTVPVVFGRTLNAEGRLLDLNKRFLAVMGRDGFGMITQVQDLDGIVRQFRDDRYFEDLGLHTMVGQMARQSGIRVNNGWIDYTIGEAIRPVPMLQVLEWVQAWRENGDETALAALKDNFSGRAVFVGGVLPFVDRHFQPLTLAEWETNPYAPGVLIHMQSYRALASDRILQEVPQTLVLLIIALAATFVFLGDRPVLGPLCVFTFAFGFLALSSYLFWIGYRIPMVPVILTAALSWLMKAALNAADNLKQKRRLHTAFSGYVGPAILNDILDGSISPGLGGESRRICVLFADVCDFTTFSEGLDAVHVLSMLNRYFGRVTPAIHDHGGTLDKYMGDGIMAFFGAPQKMPNAAKSAFDAVHHMFDELDKLNQELEKEGEPNIRIGVGLGIGDAVVGHVGAQSRFEYSAIGDTVNVAARVEGLTRSCGFKLVMTEAVVEDLPEEDRQNLVPLGKQEIKGHTPIAVFGWGPLVEKHRKTAGTTEQVSGG